MKSPRAHHTERLKITVTKDERSGWHTATAMGVSTYAYHEKKARAELANYFRRLRRKGIAPRQHLAVMNLHFMGMLRDQEEAKRRAQESEDLD